MSQVGKYNGPDWIQGLILQLFDNSCEAALYLMFHKEEEGIFNRIILFYGVSLVWFDTASRILRLSHVSNRNYRQL